MSKCKEREKKMDIEFNVSELKDRFDALTGKVEKKIHEADIKSSKSMDAAARFIANV